MRPAPKFLLQKHTLFYSVIFIVVFSILFISIYKPFAHKLWFDIKPAETLILTISFYMACLAILAVSKVLLYQYQSKHGLSISKYVLWIVVEFVLIAAVYLIFTQTFGFGDAKITLNLILRTAINVGLILAIPYTIIGFYAGYRAKVEELNVLLFQRQMRNLPHERHLVNFYDYNDNLKISIYEDYISYIESADNYVEIHYEMEDKLQSYLLRTSTQKLWGRLADTSLVRCHRSFIVNPGKISLFKDMKDHGAIVVTGQPAKEIPVSKSYYKDVCLALNRADNQE